MIPGTAGQVEGTVRGDGARPLVAVIVPVYKQSGLLPEAIESALDQIGPYDVRVIVVNDGCPFPETDRVARAYATAHQGRLVYLRQENRGLAAARNTGIDHAMDAWPDRLIAVYFLDADNRLGPEAIARAAPLLSESPQPGWVYPDIDMFGLPWHGDYSGDYSVLLHTGVNICEAGSLVGRRVFDAGVRFDENLRIGYEDWDFFLQAVEAGFRGRHCAALSLRYRKRAESMLADASRQDARLRAQLRAKHAGLYRTRTLTALEQVEAPRYAILAPERGRVRLTTDPALPGRDLAPDEFAAACWRNWLAPEQWPLPSYVVVGSRAVLERLSAGGLLHWAFWFMETEADRQGSVAVRLIEADQPGGFGYEVSDPADPTPATPDLLMLPTGTLRDRAGTESGAAETGAALHPTVAITIRLPEAAPAGSADGSPTAGLSTLTAAIRNSPYRDDEGFWRWREPGNGDRSRLHVPARLSAGSDAAVTMPRVAAAIRTVGFILPVVSFGGVERAAAQVATVLKRQGWGIHLVLFGGSAGRLTPEWRAVADSLCLIPDDACHAGAGRAYFGTHLSRWTEEGDADRAIGALHWLDVVVNCQSAAANGIMARLRRMGITTCAYLHVIDRSWAGRPVGHPYLTLGYEHAYDHILTCSGMLADWLAGMGVPPSKIIPVPNGPGYSLDSSEANRILAERRQRPAGEPLRVLYLGRFDRQKGLGRLAEVVGQCRRRALPVDWRIVGDTVLREELDAAAIAALADHLIGPVAAPADLTDHYAWADVLVLLSLWEGLPLTVLEAARVGCIPVSTRVGAVEEAVTHGVTGLLLGDKPIEECVEALAWLAADRAARSLLADQAARVAAARSWQASVGPLLTALGSAEG